ncbi:MAG TPA: 1-(5-phosphoribosyl)-5-[(5-phosphoribosylamino)methylideneamino] imidazole-4-carboxamide isomerase [Gaiellaceae bacterium]|nr:1-(5-phosphoribosyl)-5-[(5-phosphoribosylamino)methylideneamino] imidazole-4-carboxamide isomerase [Gaiellaceae bacterium]
MWFDLSIEVVPAVDVLGDTAVRLRRGDYDEVVERAEDPVDLAFNWARQGARRIHLVDLDGARSGQVRPKLVQAVAGIGLPVQASGGIRTRDDALALLFAGADRVVVGTAAWPDPTPWLELGEQVVIALDVLNGEVRTAGWLEGSGVTFEQALDRTGEARLLVTGIDRDGTLAGPDVQLVAAAARGGRRVLAAGGVRTPEDVESLAHAGAEAAVVGRALMGQPPGAP